MCMEKRVFYRVVSGLHAAINLHVAAKYPSRQPEPAPEGLPFAADEQEEITWGPNLALFEKFFDPDKTWGEGKFVVWRVAVSGCASTSSR